MKTAPKFVILGGVLDENQFDRFYTTFVPGEDQTKLASGEVAYRILGYANTEDEAEEFLFGPNPLRRSDLASVGYALLNNSPSAH